MRDLAEEQRRAHRTTIDVQVTHQAHSPIGARRAGLAAVLGALFIRPGLQLRPHAEHSEEPPSVFLDRMRQRLRTGGDIVAAEGDHIVARFAGEAGMFRYRTVELVSFSPEGVTFEHLRGPFRDCHERFRVTPASGGGSVVTHEGTFTMPMGLWGWLLGVTLVRPAFERLVAAHMTEHQSDPLTEHRPPSGPDR